MLFSFSDLLIEFRRPKKIKLETKLLPPYETNGKVTPTIGSKPTFMPIFTKIWIKNVKKTIAQKVLQKLSFVFKNICKIL